MRMVNKPTFVLLPDQTWGVHLPNDMVIGDDLQTLDLTGQTVEVHKRDGTSARVKLAKRISVSLYRKSYRCPICGTEHGDESAPNFIGACSRCRIAIQNLDDQMAASEFDMSKVDWSKI